MSKQEQRIEILKDMQKGRVMRHALRHGSSLEDFGRRILAHHERPDKGEIHYTTTADAIRNWAEDPYGKKTFQFISDVYGVPSKELPGVLNKMGLDEYVKAKREGRMIGMIPTQILKPTYYFMASALLLGHLTKEYGIPTALMVGTYETDLFYPNNSDKVNAFGSIEFPLKVDPETQRVQSVKVQLVPVGIRQSDGSIKQIATINEASGQQCNNIMVRVASASDPKDKSYIAGNEKTSVPHADAASFFALAALGINISQEEISLTDFYKEMWKHTISALRQKGELPSEKDMPMFFVEAERMYGELPKYANPPRSTVLQLNSNNAAIYDKNITQLPSGVLVRKSSRVMDPSWYYPMQYALPDLYYECSSCGGENFVRKLANAHELVKNNGLPSPEVRIPDREVPELESLCVHPTGVHLDMMSVRSETDSKVNSLVEQLETVKSKVRHGTLDKGSGRHKVGMLSDEIKKIRSDRNSELFDALINHKGDASQHMRSHELVIPPVIAATYKALLGEVTDIINSPIVQQVLRGQEYA